MGSAASLRSGLELESMLRVWCDCIVFWQCTLDFASWFEDGDLMMKGTIWTKTENQAAAATAAAPPANTTATTTGRRHRNTHLGSILVGEILILLRKCGWTSPTQNVALGSGPGRVGAVCLPLHSAAARVAPSDVNERVLVLVLVFGL